VRHTHTLARLGFDAEELDGDMSVSEFIHRHGNLLKDCKKVSGYRASATDVFTLVAVFEQSWSPVVGKTPVTLVALRDAGTAHSRGSAIVQTLDVFPSRRKLELAAFDGRPLLRTDHEHR
jgi:hypothetical protein